MLDCLKIFDKKICFTAWERLTITVDKTWLELTLIATMDLACSWKIAWRGGGTLAEASVVTG